MTILRLFNTVGPRQTGRYGMVIPRFVSAALQGSPLQVYGDGQQARTFTAVGQVVQALSDLIECKASIGQIVNIGGVAETSILALAERIVTLCDSNSEIQLVPYEAAYTDSFEDMRRRNPNTARLKELIGWAPDADLDSILLAVINDQRARIQEGARL